MASDNDVTRDDRWQRTWDLFHDALERPADERSRFLDAACPGDPELRVEVDRLLGLHQRSSGILDAGADAGGTATFGLAESLVDRRIGPYHLQEVVGEGGMGVVYSAHQTSPVRRRVALKLVRPGMDSREVLTRFESERQALAIMDHPRIAKVYDAGVTDDGRPYFVMEYVPGIPITEYCDLRGLGLRERLELFSQACEAIEHAHRKGIIHRDIKPSNLLVAAVDGKPSLKVIDFGVAKATSQRLAERTLFTRQGVLVGTPGYMSPEQAGTTPLEVDTRTDIYALGVVLYELLVGAQPFDPKTLRNVAIAEMLRIIREEDPPPPWARVTSLGPAADEVAKRRHLDVHSLVRRLRGELEWITMRALEKDASRRYASAADLAGDIRRHLSNEPVHAGPPSVAYRMGKFVRRHRTAVAVATTFVIVVAGLVGLLKVQSGRLTRALDPAALRAMLTPVEGGVVLRELWADADVMGTPSPDGRFVTFTDWTSGNLALHDFETGEDRHLTASSWPDFAEFSVVSPDGERVAYAWFGKQGYELRLVSVGDLEDRRLFHRPDTGYVYPLDWTPDGRHVLTWLARTSGAQDLALVPLDGGEPRILLSTRDTEQPGATALSPDGSTVLYSIRQDTRSERRDIRLRAVESGRDDPIVEHPAHDVPMGWSPDGRHVLFASNRTGTWDLWAVAVDDHGARGEAALIKPGFGNPSHLVPMGFTSHGSFVYGTWGWLNDVYVTDLDADGKAGPPRKVTELYEGSNNDPDWSPDGSRLAWISKRQDSYTLVIGDLEAGSQVEVPISSRMLQVGGGGIRWSPDGASILVTGRAREMESWQGVFAIDVATGEVEQVAAADPIGVLRHPQWDPRAETVYFLRRSESGSAIVAVDRATRRERVVHGSDVGAMALSRDGRWIAYTTDVYTAGGSKGTPTLNIVSTAGGEPRTIFESSEDRPFEPGTPLAWSPDGSHLFFATRPERWATQAEGLVELTRIARSGGTVEALGLAMPRLRDLRVHPGGRRLAFDAGKGIGEIWSVENLLPELAAMSGGE